MRLRTILTTLLLLAVVFMVFSYSRYQAEISRYSDTNLLFNPLNQSIGIEQIRLIFTDQISISFDQESEDIVNDFGIDNENVSDLSYSITLYDYDIEQEVQYSHVDISDSISIEYATDRIGVYENLDLAFFLNYLNNLIFYSQPALNTIYYNTEIEKIDKVFLTQTPELDLVIQEDDEVL